MNRRETRQRRAILNFLRSTYSHPTADQIYDGVRKEIPNISKGTVYRNLGVLQEMGLVNELNLDGMVSRYDARQAEHYHFRCDGCGCVFDIDMPIDRELDRKASLKTGFNVLSHQLEFRGLCNSCKK